MTTEIFSNVQKTIKAGAAEATRLASQASVEITRAAQQNNVNSPLPSDVESEIQKAANIFHSFTDIEKNEGGNVIPQKVILEAKGLVIFTVVKAGLIWSGRLGSGLVIARLEDGSWSAPSCINIGGVGVGFQMGADVTDCVIVLNTPDAVKAFSRGENVTLGGNLSVSAGPIGIGGEVSGSVLERAALYSYSKSKGLFAGVSVEGTIVIERKDTNKNFYGEEVSAEQILLGKVQAPADSTKILLEAIVKAEKGE